MRLILVQGDSDIAADGLAECLTRRYLPGLRVAAVYASASPLPLATAHALAFALETELEVSDALTAADASDQALAAAQEGAWSLIEGLRERLELTDAAVLVTDEAVVRALICRALNLDLTARERFRIDPGSASVIDLRQRLLVSRINDTRHLVAPAASPS